ncbi:MAG TPA: fibronectin type III domain-containing protein, partial [Bacteroidia bacterium]|nr:fibronectin type III domain-containing protein [Bacteroidia bacterium]
PPVPLATVSATIDTVVKAQIAAQTRSKGTASAMHAAVVTLTEEMKQLAAYVSNIANQHPADGDAIIKGANMLQRIKASNPNNGYRIHTTKVAGQLFIMTVRVPKAAYEFEMTTDPTNATSWVNIYKGLKVKFLKTGLTSGTRYYIRVKTVTVYGESAPSDVLSAIVQ